MKRSPIKRKTPPKRTPLRRVSKKRAKENSAYSKRIKEWKLENPYCMACVPIAKFTHAGLPTRDRTKDCHHMAGKEGKLLLDETWWLPVCRRCHDWIGDYSNAARELGLLAPKNM